MSSDRRKGEQNNREQRRRGEKPSLLSRQPRRMGQRREGLPKSFLHSVLEKKQGDKGKEGKEEKGPRRRSSAENGGKENVGSKRSAGKMGSIGCYPGKKSTILRMERGGKKGAREKKRLPGPV